MTLLTTADGDVFATSVASYRYHPPVNDITNRIILQVAFDGIAVEAIIDTGSPFGVCPLWIAEMLGLNPVDAIEEIPYYVRGLRLQGSLHRLDVEFLGVQGEHMIVNATIFVPNADELLEWGEHPAYIGLTGCLERMRFAVDPDKELFYFGPI